MQFTEENLQGLLNKGYERAMMEDKAKVVAFYAFLFNDPDPCAWCKGKLKSYWDKLHAQGISILKNIEMKKNKSKTAKQEATNQDLQLQTTNETSQDTEKECLFKLREELTSLQMDFGSSVWFNNHNLTNEIAVQYLKINPNRIANFEVYPENWEELVSG